jgi:hypothetical protein
MDGPRFEEVEEGGDARKGEIADKDGGVEASMALLFLDGVAAFLVEEWIGFEDYGGVSGGRGAKERHGLMAMMVLLTGWSWKK